jgi:hypothetical protein
VFTGSYHTKVYAQFLVDHCGAKVLHKHDNTHILDGTHASSHKRCVKIPLALARELLTNVD